MPMPCCQCVRSQAITLLERTEALLVMLCLSPVPTAARQLLWLQAQLPINFTGSVGASYKQHQQLAGECSQVMH